MYICKYIKSISIMTSERVISFYHFEISNYLIKHNGNYRTNTYIENCRIIPNMYL